MADDIRQWLEEHELGKYRDVFVENDIDLDLLSEISDDDLKDIGVASLGHRRRLLRAIAQLDSNEGAPINDEANRQPNQRSTVAERRQLTVMFCDLVGSTALSRRLDPEDLRNVMRGYQDAVAGAVTRYGGHVAKYLGDGVLAYFGWPQGYEDQAERAVRGGLDAADAVAALGGMDGEKLAARVGIATGQVVVGDLVGEAGRDAAAVTGETPNFAARLQQVARPGQVVIGAATQRLVGRSFELEDLGGHDLKGFDDPMQIWRVTGDAVAESRFEAAHGASLASFVGRDTELQLLRERRQLARSGEGQAVLISGEPGIGKSRFVAQLREDLQGGDGQATWLIFQCAPYRSAIPFHPITAQINATAGLSTSDIATGNTDKLATALALESNDDEALALIGAALGFPENSLPNLDLAADRRRIRTMEVFVERLLALGARGPLVVVLEDAHWADPTSLETFEILVDRLADAPVMLIVTHRPEYEATWLHHPHVMTLQLTRLTKRQAGDMVDQLASNRGLPRAVVEGILERTDGVPLFLEELTASIMEASEGSAKVTPETIEMPSTLQDSLHARLDRLGEAKVAAQIGAVIGREFDPDLLATLMNLSGAEIAPHLDRLVASGLVLSRGKGPEQRFLFKHALVQDVAYGSLLRSHRRDLHQRLGELLERRDDSGSIANPSVLAHHFTEAGDMPRAKRYWRESLDDAQRRWSEHEALECIKRLLETSGDDPGSQEEEMKLQLQKGNLIAALEGFFTPLAGPSYERVRELAQQLGDTRYQAHAQIGLAFTSASGIDDALLLQEEALRFAIEHGVTETYACGYSLRGTFSYVGGDFRGCVDLLETAWKEYQKHGDGPEVPFDSRLWILNFMGVNLTLLGYPDQGLKWHRRALDETLKFVQPYSRVISYTIAAAFRSYRREADECMEIALQALRECEEHRYRFFQPHSGLYEAWALCLMGRGLEKREFLQSAIQDFIKTGELLVVELFAYVLADALLQAGQIADASEAVNTGLETIAVTKGNVWRAELHRLHAEIRKAAGDNTAEEVEAEFHKALSVAQRQEAKLLEIRAATGLAKFYVEQGRHEEARNLLLPVYEWFTEGFETPDLKDAKSLLDQLA